MFGDRLISRFGPVNWPPRSCDLTPLDYFLWGYVKSLVYADKPQTLDHLEDNIRRVIADIRPQMLEKVIENWTSRLDYIRASRGSHMPEIILKMDDEPLARVPLMARGTSFWARHLSERSTAIDSSINEFSERFSQFKELSEMLKFIMYPDVRSFYKLNLPQFDWMEIEEFEMQLY
ncbi:general transcription factor II-I repeat domain-containing protein 2A [Trichonephila clavipes]|nr:general transcription factor II-I repeat domain-containing protein 2A [Trichonephila clavipes]